VNEALNIVLCCACWQAYQATNTQLVVTEVGLV